MVKQMTMFVGDSFQKIIKVSEKKGSSPNHTDTSSKNSPKKGRASNNERSEVINWEAQDEEFRLNKNNPDLKTKRFGGYTEFENCGLSISKHPW